jgi:hypothetical protein
VHYCILKCDKALIYPIICVAVCLNGAAVCYRHANDTSKIQRNEQQTMSVMALLDSEYERIVSHVNVILFLPHY